MGDSDLNNAGTDQIASNLLDMDHSDDVLPAPEQPPSRNLSLLHAGCEYLANHESFPQNLVPYPQQSDTELQCLIPCHNPNLFSAFGQADAEVEAEVEPEVAHAAKDLSGKRKCGRKYKGAVRAVDDEEPELEPEMAQTTNASVPWRAPEARMY